MSLRFSLFATAIVLVSALLAAAQGGEYEAARSSSLTAVSLPAGAQRVFPNHVPAEIEQTLETLVAQGGGKLRRSGTEVLLWTGSDLRKTGTRTIVSRLTDTLKVAGWQYEVGGTENGITFFSLVKDGAERRAVIGFHGEADGTFLFAWTELQATNEGERTSEPANTGTANGAAVGNMPGYEFTTPAGWSRSDSGDKIILGKGDDRRYR